jgi:hypothetical protein
MQSAKFEFILNLQTARLLGLPIPETPLATADEVIKKKPSGLPSTPGPPADRLAPRWNEGRADRVVALAADLVIP